MTVQIELSQLLDKVQGIGAGILTLFDIVNLNKTTYPEEVTSFFQVMEVYGQNTDLHVDSSGFEPLVGTTGIKKGAKVDNLKILRLKSLEQLTHVTEAINKARVMFSELAKEPLQEHVKDKAQLERLVRGVNAHL